MFGSTPAGLSAGLTWDTSAFASNGSIGVAPIPEPSLLKLLGMAGLVSLAYACRRCVVRRDSVCYSDGLPGGEHGCPMVPDFINEIYRAAYSVPENFLWKGHTCE
jgi:hypothetical protein